MPSDTTFYAIAKPDDIDPLADIGLTLREAIDRIDYMLGESGEDSILPSAANTKTTKTISFGRTYSTPPRVLLSLGGDNNNVNMSPGILTLWVDDVTASGFTVAIQRTSAVAAAFTWQAKPKRTDT